MTTHSQPTACATMNSRTGFSPRTGERRSLEVLVARAVGHFNLLQAWNDRARQRRRLGQLDDRLLADIGVSRTAAAHEAAKLPWQD